MAADDTVDHRQADAGAGKIALRVQPLKRREQAAGVGLLEPGAVVADEKGLLAAHVVLPDLDLGRLGAGGELPGVVEQLLERELEQPPVGGGAQPVDHGQRHFTRRFGLLQPPPHRQRQRRHVQRRARQRRASDPGQLQQIVDLPRHLPRRGRDARQVLTAVFGKHVAAFVERDLAEALDRAQRRPQVVRNRPRERLDLLIGGGTLGLQLLDTRRQPGYLLRLVRVVLIHQRGKVTYGSGGSERIKLLC